VAIALFLTWYAALGGWRALDDALSELGLSPLSPLQSPESDSAQIPLRLFVQLALLVVAVILIRLARAQRVAGNRRTTHSLTERRLWAEHLAWLAATPQDREAQRLAR